MLARIHQTIIGAAIAVALTAGATHAPTASAPQTVVPTPLPPSANPDTPGGAARNGVIAPPVPRRGRRDQPRRPTHIRRDADHPAPR